MGLEQGQLEKIGVLHPVRLNAIPPERLLTWPPNSDLPTPFSEEPHFCTTAKSCYHTGTDKPTFTRSIATNVRNLLTL
jgi:hypothetical protein